MGSFSVLSHVAQVTFKYSGCTERMKKKPIQAHVGASESARAHAHTHTHTYTHTHTHTKKKEILQTTLLG